MTELLMAKVKGVDQLFPKVLLVQHSVILTLPADTSSSYVLYMLMLWVFPCVQHFTAYKSLFHVISFGLTPCKGARHIASSGWSCPAPCPTISLLMTSKFLSAALTFLLKPDAENQLPAVLPPGKHLKGTCDLPCPTLNFWLSFPKPASPWEFSNLVN